jgi:hypothetical protein
MSYLIIGMLVILVIILGLSNKPPTLPEPTQFIMIKGEALNPDHIVSFWKQNGTLHLMTDTRSTFRNGSRDNYYRWKLTEEEMEKYFYLLLERRVK